MVHENYNTYVIIRIQNKSVKRDNGCIEWVGVKNNNGYGLIGIAPAGYKSPVSTSRALYMAVNDCFGLPKNVVIRHTCDNPSCVNIKHLVAGSQKDNHKDILVRDRRAKKYRPHTRLRKFDDLTIQKIREATGKLKYIAEEFGTTTGYVSKIKNMKAKAPLK